MSRFAVLYEDPEYDIDPEYYEDADQNWQDSEDLELDYESYDPFDTVNS